MPTKNLNQQPPFLGPKHPIYPPHMQTVRVLGGTIPGPSGYASSSARQPNLYLGETQQVRTDTILPRDREPCLVLDVNGFGLASGYYEGRLVTNYQSLPVYAVGNAGAFAVPFFPQPLPQLGSSSARVIPPGPGLTPPQIGIISQLSPAQIESLNNLNPCQVQVFLSSLTTGDVQLLTSNLTSTQLSTFVNQLTTEQLSVLYSNLTLSKIIFLTTALNQQQTYNLTTALNNQQVATLTGVLTRDQLRAIANLPAPTLSYVISNVTTSQLTNTLNNLNPGQTATLFTLPAQQIVSMMRTMTAGQIQTFLTQQTTGSSTSLTPLSVRTEGGTAFAIGAADFGKFIILTNSAAKSGTIPGASTVGPGWFTTIQNPGAGTATITSGGGTINGASSLSIPGTQGATLISDGTNWQVSTPIAGATISGSGSSRTEGTLAAAGTDQATAAAITTDAVVVSGADGTKGVILPGTVAGLIGVRNDDALSSLYVYPPSGARIGNGATDAAVSLGMSAAALFIRLSATQWQQITTS